MMDKKTVKEEIEKIQQAVVDDLTSSHESLETSADIDENEPIDPEDLSRQNELGSMARRVKFMLEKAEDDLKTLKKLPLETGEEIKEGSLVLTDSYAFYVGIAVHPFDIDDTHIVSISTEAPIYAAMKGKKKGETFSLAGKEYKITDVK